MSMQLTLELQRVAANQSIDVRQKFIAILVVVDFLADSFQTDRVHHWIRRNQWLFDDVELKIA